MKRILVALATCAVVLGASAPVASAHDRHHHRHHHERAHTADLSVTMTFVGKGRPHAKVGQTATFAIVVRNLGPGAAEQVRVGTGMGDQFNAVSISCGSGIPDFNSACTIPRLARHGKARVTFVAVVCCFPEGESRDAFVGTTVSSPTPDPNPDNNVQQVIVHITGGHGFFPPV